MSEIIKGIKESTFILKKHYSNFDGFEIFTSKRIIKVGISNSQNCCESFGCLWSGDSFEDFKDAELLSFNLVDTGLNKKMIEAGENLDCGDVMFVNFETSKGLFQIAAYNGHNGYYGHDAVVIENEFNNEDKELHRYGL